MSKPETTWHAFYTGSALKFIQENITSERVVRKLFDYRELIESQPYIGRAYDPEYAAARPPFPCRFVTVPDTPFTIFYFLDEDEHHIVHFCIEYQRKDPNARFSSINWDVIDW